jgi:hypothetical protein
MKGEGDAMAKQPARWTPADLFVPGLSLILALYYLYTIRGLARLAQMYGGSLSILCIALFFVAFILVLRSGGLGIRGAVSRLGILASENRKFLGMTALTALFIGLIAFVGYPAASILFVAATAFSLKYAGIGKTLAVSFVVTLVGVILFILFLNVDLPLDPLSNAIKGAF